LQEYDESKGKYRATEVTGGRTEEVCVCVCVCVCASFLSPCARVLVISLVPRAPLATRCVRGCDTSEGGGGRESESERLLGIP